MFDKLKFWKSKDEFDDFGLGDDPALPPLDDQHPPSGQSLGLPPSQDFDLAEQPQFGQQRQPPAIPAPRQQMQPASYSPQSFPAAQTFSPPSYQPQQQQYQVGMTSRDIDVVIAKLDSIRLQIEALSQRLANIEQSAAAERTNKRQFW